MNGSYTETAVAEEMPGHLPPGPPSRYINGLRSHSPSKRASSAMSKIYKSASTLYLTRRLSEALQAIEPLVVVPAASTANSGSDDERDRDNGATVSTSASPSPPIATATRSLRVKVWNFYLTLLNAIIELGPEDGKAEFGTAVWKGIASKVRNGAIWEEVVQSGYAGREGSVDADVVANLATLLLGQSPSQALTQQRLETYLSLSSQPEVALADRLNDYERGSTALQRRPSYASGTNTPRDLNARAKILELYTLHVLPRNQEWDTSREFIRNSNELDDERKDAFLYTLDSLQDQAQNEQDQEQELLRQRDEELARQRQEAEQKRLEESRMLDDRSRATSEAASQASSSRGVASSKAAIQQQQNHNRTESEVDYGIDDTKVRRPLRKKESSSRALRPSQGHASRSTNSGGAGGGTTGGGGSAGKSLPRAARPTKRPPPRTLISRIPTLLRLLRTLLANMARSMTENPQILLRNLLFLLAFIIALARRDVRERVGRITGAGWQKVRATIGMGTKVSYI